MSGSAPSTATVLEFRCLFTHDLRRKQKRWQDGRLKYHSFNARVMVYDERGNSVGDMHWHGEYDFGEGEEVQLDRGGVIVQVEELVERMETDLSELVDKRLQEKQQRQLARSAASSAVLPNSLPRPPAIAPDRAHPPRHRPLHHFIGTPTGHHGKAVVPKESPYEQRQQSADTPDDRAAKRRKYDDLLPSKSGYASALFGQPLALSATPSSSVSTIRRPRPEARSDPPPEADTPDTRKEPKPARREKPQPSRRLNQTGYAQSLFGQTLTLSHTPVSSVPSRPQPRNESASSPVDNSYKQDHREAGQPVPPRQPIESHHPGQPGSKPRPALLSSQTSTDTGLAKGSAGIGFSKAHASVSRRNHAKFPVQIIPENIDIIEIHDPEPVAPPPIRQTRTQKATPASLRSQEESGDSSSVPVGQKPVLQEDSVRPRKQQRLEHGRGSEPRKAKGLEQTKKPETAVSKAYSRNAGSGHMDPATHENVSHVPVVTRDQALPVTELRIKSSKKRGLLIISDTLKAKKTRRRVAADSATPFEGSARHHSKDSDDDDPFRSPASRSAGNIGNGRYIGKSAGNPTTVHNHSLRNGDADDDYLDYPVLNYEGQWEDEQATSELRKQSAQRTISTELGEDDDPFRSSSPEVLEQTYARPEPAKGVGGMQMGHAVSKRVETTAQVINDGLSAGKNGRREPAGPVRPANRSSSPPRVGYDRYRIPSSPQASGPGSSSSAQRKGHGHDIGDEKLRPIDNNEKLSKAKKHRHVRRKIICDEDDEDDAGPLASSPRKTRSDSSSKLAKEAPKKQSKPCQDTSIKINAQEVFPMAEPGEQRPERALGEPRGQQNEAGMGSDEDEPPIKRRQSTRQRRSRAASYEEPLPLPSEQDGSEEEEIPRKRRKTKTAKASGDRPRLEKIKKNVKSRGLIGFNLTALNAPLGLRGIGMPFSILPSPVNESIQRLASDHAVVDETLSPDLSDSGRDQVLPPDRNQPAAPFKTNAEAQRKGTTPTSNKEAPDRVIHAQSKGPVIKGNIQDENVSGGVDRVDGPGNPRLPENLAFMTPDTPADNEQLSGYDASSSREKRTSRQQPAPNKTRLEAQQYHAAAPTPQDNAAGASFEHLLPSLNQLVQHITPTLQKQSSTGSSHAKSEGATSEVPRKTVENAQLPPAPPSAPATKPLIYIGARDDANDQQPSKTVRATCDETEAPTKEPVAAENIAADLPSHKTAKPQEVTSLNQQKPGFRRHTSNLGPAHASNTAESDPTVPTGAPAAPPAVTEPDAVLNQYSLTSGAPKSVTAEKTVDRPGSDTASDLHVRQPNAIGLRRPVSAPRRINNIAAKVAPRADPNEASSTDVHLKPASNVRLANPASRGRKAALASHAAGQVPQRILPPTQPALMVPVSTADLAMTPIEQAPREPERPKKKMTFPGFQSARSDGPWSREAFDLLESGRPG